MAVLNRVYFPAVLVILLTASWGNPADIDRTAVDFKTPADIKWVRNAAGTNESAVLFGDPSKPGPYVVRLKWLPGNMSRPHFHPNDRFFVVLSGTWWMGTGEKFDRARTCRKLRHPLCGQDPLRWCQGRGDDHPSLGYGTGNFHACGKTLVAFKTKPLWRARQ